VRVLQKLIVNREADFFRKQKCVCLTKKMYICENRMRIVNKIIILQFLQGAL